jgi:hypothetical protein
VISFFLRALTPPKSNISAPWCRVRVAGAGREGVLV